jgi:hypothetical protein
MRRKKQKKKTVFNERAIGAWNTDVGGILGNTKSAPARGAVLGGRGTRAFFGTEKGILRSRRR